jgi:RNA polymerase sigma-70 factor (ECF subfamily)
MTHSTQIPKTPGNSSDEFVEQLISHQPRLYAYVVSLLPHRADAEEVFQETCMVLWAKWKEFEPQSNFLAWACQIALNKTFNFRKRQARSRLVFGDEFLQTISDHKLASVERTEARSMALAGCIEKLKDRDRDLLDRWYQKHGTTKDLAQQLGRPIDTVYKAMKRIRQALFDCVTQNMADQRTK